MSLKPPKPSALVPGYRLDRYELLCPIAQGGMAEVWVARLRGKHGFEKLVAIKTILPEFAEDPSFQRMFLDEAHIASGIEHQNVAQILDLGEEHEVLYLVMEWVDGDALSKLQRAVVKKQMTIPIGVVLRILADTCGGLHAAHELSDKEGRNLGVVHRDVSPQNILVNNKGLAKLIDFGIAKARNRLGGETSSGVFKGKIQYMAPEQALGRAIDRRADVWAIGAILHHLVVGKPPFEGDNQLATLHLLASGRPPRPMPTSVPAAVADVVRRTLKHDPEKRIENAAELQKAIEAAMAEAWVNTSNAEVGAFIAEHLGDRAESRRKAVDLALQAAAERIRMMEALKPPPSSDISSMSGVTHPERKRGSPAMPAGLLPADDSGEIGIAPPLDLHASAPTMRPLSETSTATTLGSSSSSAIASSEVLDASPHRARRRTAIVIGVVVAASALLAVVGVVAVGRTRNDHREAATGQSISQPRPIERVSAASAKPVDEGVIASAAPSASASEKRAEPKAPTISPPTRPKSPLVAPSKPKPGAVPTPKKIDDGF